jgi:hypothetical protein
MDQSVEETRNQESGRVYKKRDGRFVLLTEKGNGHGRVGELIIGHYSCPAHAVADATPIIGQDEEESHWFMLLSLGA